MNYEEKIQELENRIEKLERIEKSRRTKRIVSIIFKIILFCIILFAMYKLYIFIKPYFDQIGNLKGLTEGLNLDGNSLSNELNSLFNN